MVEYWHGEVTPAMARKWLEGNHLNRMINNQRVNTFARDMKAGRWRDNGETICFDTTGALLNGQHRLSAVVKSGCPVMMSCIFGVEDGGNYDTGRPRNSRDTLILNGVSPSLATNPNISLIKLIKFMEYGTQATIIISNDEIMEFIKQHESSFWELNQITAGLRTGHSAGLRVNIRRAPLMVALFFAIENGADTQRLRDFVTICNTGICTSEQDTAAAVFRNDLLKTQGKTTANLADRLAFELAAEKAISDFLCGVARRKTYLGTSAPSFKRTFYYK